MHLIRFILRTFKLRTIDLFYNGDQIKYSFAVMLISLSSLDAMQNSKEYLNQNEVSRSN